MVGEWRRGWDSNPRYACTYNGFRDRPDRPLRHLSARNSGRTSVVPIHRARRSDKPHALGSRAIARCSGRSPADGGRSRTFFSSRAKETSGRSLRATSAPPPFERMPCARPPRDRAVRRTLPIADADAAFHRPCDRRKRRRLPPPPAPGGEPGPGGKARVGLPSTALRERRGSRRAPGVFSSSRPCSAA